jgi:hypothetical protein
MGSYFLVFYLPRFLQVFLVLSAFVGLEAVNLQCIMDLWPPRNTIGCFAINVNVTERDLTVSSINGQFLRGFRHSNFKMFQVKNQILHFIPCGIGSFFPKTVELRIIKSKLKEVHKRDLQQFPHLKELHLEQNELQFLPGDLFEANLELETIDFDNNQITHVGHNLLTSLTKLDVCGKTARNHLKLTTSRISKQ